MILASAVKYKGVVFTGVRHCEIFSDLRRLGHDGPFYESNGYLQGFIDDAGLFLNREDAKEEVIASGQTYYHHANTLTSEDLWP